MIKGRCGKPWKGKDKRVLQAMWQNGAYPSQIARRLGRSEISVKSKLTRLRLPYVRDGQLRPSAFDGTRILNSGKIPTKEQKHRDQVALWARDTLEQALEISEQSQCSSISTASTLVGDSDCESSLSDASTVAISDDSPITGPKQKSPSISVHMNANAAAFNFNANPQSMPAPFQPQASTKVSSTAVSTSYSPQSPVEFPIGAEYPSLPPLRLPSWARNNAELTWRRVLPNEDILAPASGQALKAGE